MSAELGLESSDPLNMLLTTPNPDSASDDSPEASTDWAKFSTLWADNSEQLKPYGDMMDFSDMAGLSMDMDFNPGMTIEPNMLSYDAMKFNNFTFDEQFSAEFLAGNFPFSFQANPSSDISSSSESASPQSFTRQRRDSVTSSSSSSGASLSPVPESVPSPQSGYISDTVQPIQPKEEPCMDPVAELAQRVRQSAGVMLAVPMNAQVQGMDIQIPGANGAQGKLPIPRLPRANPTSSPQFSNPSVSSSAASTPPPSTPPSGYKPAANMQMSTSASSVIGDATTLLASSNLPRPKTSHTTIERRYRTNLNARIQSLRMAVPALRVLEDREGGNGKKIKKNVKTTVIVKGSGADIHIDENAGVDVIDERGFVDGVKVARKCSKANVLGKAVEYIRVLKKREQRLKAEQAGLKTLISGLVGGPALVREWEKEWRSKFGGEEKDEVEGDDEEGDDDDSDEEDGDDGDEDGRKRKRAKVASNAAAPKKPAEKEKKPPAPPAPVTTDASGNIVQEKRKRGRPRKILPPPATTAPVASSADASAMMMQGGGDFAQQQQQMAMAPVSPQWSQQPAQPQQFLLAVFALFSFFNSPLTASSSSPMQHAHHHTGTVLTPLAYAPELVPHVVTAAAAASWAVKEYLQMFHLVVSVLVIASLLGNWFGFNLAAYLEKSFARSRKMYIHSVTQSNSKKSSSRTGPTNWMQLGEECVLEGQTASLSLYERFQMYRSITSKVHLSVTDLATLALVIRGTGGVFEGAARRMAAAMWSSATKRAHPKHPIRMSEQLVFDTLDIDDAAAYLARAGPGDRADEDRVYTPLQVLGAMVVKDRIKSHLGSLFVDGVDEHAEKGDDAPVASRSGNGNNSSKEDAEPEWRQTIEAARELGGHIEELGRMLERVWKAESGVSADEVLAFDVVLGELADSDSGVTTAGVDTDTDIEALLAALVLYRAVFPRAAADDDDWLSSSTSTLLSPPPTPTSKASLKRGMMLRALRTVLGSRVFEDAGVAVVVEQPGEGRRALVGCLEDARDLVVDMIFDAERPLRALVSS